MKIAFVHDIAHVAFDLSKALNRLGVETEIIEATSLFGLVKKIKKSNADIFHANYVRSPAFAAVLASKPFAVHAHGDDIRYGLSMLQRIAVSKAKMRFYSTQDLAGIMKDSKLLPRPVDLERFYPRNTPSEKKSVYFRQTTSDQRLTMNEANYIDRIQTISDSRGYELWIAPSMTSIPYNQMPEFLSQFSLLFDKEFPKNEYSKTALEALAMKIEVYKENLHGSYDFVVNNHGSDHVARTLLQYYELKESVIVAN